MDGRIDAKKVGGQKEEMDTLPGLVSFFSLLLSFRCCFPHCLVLGPFSPSPPLYPHTNNPQLPPFPLPLTPSACWPVRRPDFPFFPSKRPENSGTASPPQMTGMDMKKAHKVSPTHKYTPFVPSPRRQFLPTTYTHPTATARQQHPSHPLSPFFPSHATHPPPPLSPFFPSHAPKQNKKTSIHLLGLAGARARDARGRGSSSSRARGALALLAALAPHDALRLAEEKHDLLFMVVVVVVVGLFVSRRRVESPVPVGSEGATPPLNPLTD